jgi:excisionase family DNA binding protein
MEPILVSVNGAAHALNLGRTSIYALINEGRLETIKLGRRTLIRVESIRRLVETQE